MRRLASSRFALFPSILEHQRWCLGLSSLRSVGKTERKLSSTTHFLARPVAVFHEPPLVRRAKSADDGRNWQKRRGCRDFPRVDTCGSHDVVLDDSCLRCLQEANRPKTN